MTQTPIPHSVSYNPDAFPTCLQYVQLTISDYSNTGFVQLLDRFHQYYVLESQRILTQRLSNDSSTFQDLHRGQQARMERMRFSWSTRFSIKSSTPFAES